jgi:filamentous hemagglutinin family protein
MKPCTTLHLVTLTLVATNSAWAEVTLDGSLGRAGALPGPNYQIGANLGQQQGGNLFHSFRDFNLQSHESATFSGPTNVQNVISRVTGGNPSSIDGTLRSTIPNANMYFLNPFGIMFGPNAKLDVQGSFHASTADTLRLQDGGQFHARVPSNSLLTVAPPEAFGFLTDTPAAIAIQDSHLSVPEGKTLSLIGGDLRLTGSRPYTLDGTQFKFNAELLAPGGRINLASVASQGEVISTDTDLTLSQVAQRGTIRAQNALIETSGRRGGSVFIRGGQFELTGSRVLSQTNGDQNGGPIDVQVDNLKLWQGSQISSGTLGTGNAGSVSIKTDTMEVSGKHESGSISAIASASATENSGNAGQIEITARQVTLADDAQITSSTMGQGHAGAIILKVADSLTLTGGNIFAASLGTMPQAGNGNNIEITARQIELTNGGGISTFTVGTGHGGSILLKGIDTLTISGNMTSGVSSIVATSGNKELKNAGNAGSVEIEARQITLTEGGRIHSMTLGAGKAGKVVLRGVDTLRIGEQSFITALSGGSGDAGQIEITARQILLTNGGKIATGTSSTGDGGSIVLKVADSLTLTGSDKEGNPSTITANSVGKMPQAGNAGSIEITARQITVMTGGQIGSNTAGTGQGGSVILKGIDTLTVSGNVTNEVASMISANSSNKELANAGNAGTVEIEARQINLTEYGFIASTTFGAGNAGKVVLHGVDTLVIGEQSFIMAISGGSGEAGNVEIEAREIKLTARGNIQSGTLGTGKGGKVVLRGVETLLINQSGVNSLSGSGEENGGDAGKVEIEARQILLTNGGRINSSTSGTGRGGSILLTGIDTLTISGSSTDGVSSGILVNSSNAELANAGAAGNVEIEARQIVLTDGGQLGSDTYGTGQGGSVILKVADSLILTGSASIIGASSAGTMTQAGNAGQITIQARQVTVTDGAQINSLTKGSGHSGTIHLQVSDTLTVTGQDAEGSTSSISASSENAELDKAGNAGNLEIEARQVVLTQGGLSSSTSGTGQGGSIILKVAENLTQTGSNIVTNSNGTMVQAGNAGQITIQARQVTLTDGSQVNSLTQGGGHGGTIHLQVADTLTATGQDAKGNPSGIHASSNNEELEKAGNAGNLEIEARQIVLTNGGQLASDTSGTGQGGSIILKITDDLTMAGTNTEGGGGTIAASSQSTKPQAGNAGNVTIQARQVNLADGTQINSSTSGGGQGGTIHLQVSETLTASGQDAKGYPSAIMARSANVELEKAGKAGRIEIESRQIVLTDGGQINTRTDNASGGDITLLTPNLLYLRNGEITTSVKGGTGNGGNITINNPVFVVLNQGQIKAQADQGRGGNIDITSQQFLKTPQSIVSASSRMGINGTVTIRAPNETVSNSLNLPPALLDVTNRLPKLCRELSEEEYDNLSHFFIHPRAVTGPSPDDLQGGSVWFLLPYFRTTSPPPGKVQAPVRQGQVQTGAKPWLVMMECQKMKKTAEKKSAGKTKNLKVRQQVK